MKTTVETSNQCHQQCSWKPTNAQNLEAPATLAGRQMLKFLQARLRGM